MVDDSYSNALHRSIYSIVDVLSKIKNKTRFPDILFINPINKRLNEATFSDETKFKIFRNTPKVKSKKNTHYKDMHGTVSSGELAVG